MYERWLVLYLNFVDNNDLSEPSPWSQRELSVLFHEIVHQNFCILNHESCDVVEFSSNSIRLMLSVLKNKVVS